MQMSLVKGRATSTLKHRSLDGAKLLVCHHLGVHGQTIGDPVLAVDKLGASVGDRVILTSDGVGLRSLLGYDNSPVRWWTIGIVD